MKILFMGTPDFAAASLQRLIDGKFQICGVFSQPDRPKNRGLKLEETPVKKLALKYGIQVFQPEKLKDGTALNIIRDLAPDIIVVVAYGRILPKDILDYPKFGCVNIHGSLLPKYRGSAPIQWSILNGERITGVTSMYMDVGMDTGDIIDVRTTEIGEKETSGELFDRLKELGGELLCDTLRKIESGTASRTKQTEAEATYAPPLSKDMCPIDWSKSSEEIINHIRGLNPWPVATAKISGETFKIFKAEKLDDAGANEAGKILFADKRGLAVASKDGAVLITELQAPGKKRMAASDYIRGHKLC